MGTRGVVGVAHDGGYRGRYVDHDAYPTWTGPRLLEMYLEHGSDPAAVIAHLMKDGQAGYWSSIAATDEGAWNVDEEFRAWIDPSEDCGAEWAYLLDDKGITVVASMREDGRKAIGACGTIGDVVLDNVVRVPWDATDVDWRQIECGENFERCTHYAWVHFPEAKDLRVGTLVWLRRVEPHHDHIEKLVLWREGNRIVTLSGGMLGSADNPHAWQQSWRVLGSGRQRKYWWVTTRDGHEPIRAFWILKDGRFKLEPKLTGIIPTAEGDRLVLAGTVL